MAKSYLGIDVDSGHLKLVVCSRETIELVVIELLPDNLVKDGRITSLETMSEILRDAVRKNKISTKNAALVLHSNDVFTRRIALPAMTADELKINLPFEFKDYIAEGKDKYRFDYAILDTKRDGSEEYSPQETPASGLSANTAQVESVPDAPIVMNVLAAAALNDTITSYENMCKRAGLKLKKAAPDIMSYAAIVDAYETRIRNAGTRPDAPGASSLMPQTPYRDFCFIDIGGSDTKVYLFPQGRYEVTRVIEVGMSTLATAVADHFSIDITLAKTYLETNYENAQDIAECNNIYERLGIELARIISFFNFNYPDSQLDAVYYCGIGSLVAPLIETLVEHLSIDVLDIDTIMPPSTHNHSNARLCPAAVGIAMQ
ncbi:MAG: pilus assembly protein PilM [Gordonibacter sp.]|nr:pilus assembly protein PilM [Gordonibacter sp.]